MTQNQYLWSAFVQGDKEALSAIFLENYDDLFRYGQKMVKNHDVVKDAIQDLFLKLWKNRLNLRSVALIKPYLFRALRNHLIDLLSLQKSVVPLEADLQYPFEVVYSPEDFMINNQLTVEVRNEVINALNELMPRQREVIYLRFFEELDFETIAGIMDMNVQSVRNALHRGMTSLREKMLLSAFLLMFCGISEIIY